MKIYFNNNVSDPIYVYIKKLGGGKLMFDYYSWGYKDKKAFEKVVKELKESK
tara:strand:- start:38323 stop:38478 length:156 start_codon:yes stop_codon:yes gene_type:complete